MHQLRLQFVKLGLGFLSVGQISHKTREMAAGAGAHFADGKVHGEGRTVLAPPRDHAPDADNMAFAGRFVSREVAVMSAAVRFRHQDEHILSDRLRRIEAKQPFGRGAEGLHDAVFVDHDHRVRHGLKDGLEVFFTRSQRMFHPL